MADDQFKEKDIIVTGVIDDIKRDLVVNPMSPWKPALIGRSSAFSQRKMLWS